MAKTVRDISGKKEREEGNLQGVGTIDGIIKAFYESISFVSGMQPDFRQMRFLFHPHGRLVPPKSEKHSSVQVLDLEMFIKQAVEDIVLTGAERRGLASNEVARRMHSFGNIVQVFSTFEAKHSPRDPVPVHRGIYSVQLIRDSQRWWIFSLTWDYEKPGNSIPRAYLV